MLDVIHNWCIELDSIKTSHDVSAAFVNISKDFEKMEPNILLRKLNDLGVCDLELLAAIDNLAAASAITPNQSPSTITNNLQYSVLEPG